MCLHSRIQCVGAAQTLWGGCFDKGFTSLPKDLKQYWHKKPQINSTHICQNPDPIPTTPYMQANEFRHLQRASFQTNRQLFKGGKRKMRSGLWPEKKVTLDKCHVLPQGKSVCVTLKVKQVKHNKQGLDDSFLLKSSGVRLQVTQ